MRKFMSGILACITLAATSCAMVNSESQAARPVVLTALKFSKDKLTVAVGGSEYLKLRIEPSKEQNNVQARYEYPEEYLSINADSSGVIITGLKEGTAYIKAIAGGISAQAIITVEGYAAEYTGEPYIYSNYSVLELTPGSSDTVSASLYGGSGADAEDFSWEVADPGIAEIGFARGNCVVKTHKTGLTHLTARHPKAAYPYTFIIYVYSDDFSQSYLTTTNNILTINRAEEGARTVGVEVAHPAETVRQAGFSWEVTGDGGKYISVTPNGEKAIITPRENGLAVLRVRYDHCVYPLDILVRVTKTVQNVYVTTSTATLVVNGSDTSANIYAELAGDYKGFANPDGFSWSVLDAEAASQIMDWTSAGNTFSVTGKYNGSAKVRVTHELSDWARTVLVVLREQAGSAKDTSMYITTSSNYVQTKVGAEEFAVKVSLAGGVPGDEAFLRWELEGGGNNPVIRARSTAGKVSARAAGSFAYGDIYITPLQEGEAVISVTHPKILYATEVLVRVYSRYALLEEPAVIQSDIHILKLLNGTEQTVTVTLGGNKDGASENGIEWASEDAGAVEVSPARGSRTLVRARGSGNHQTYISASHAKAVEAKRILVLSADTQEALDTMKYIYTESAYIRVNAGGSAEARISQAGMSADDIRQISWTSDRPGVAVAAVLGGDVLLAKVTGIDTGEAVIRASAPGVSPCAFYVTVLPVGESTGVIRGSYLTTAKNAAHLSAPGESAALTVTGVNISDYDMTRTRWVTEDSAVVTVTGNGGAASVAAAGTGKTRVIVSNPASSNSLAIDIKVGALYEWDDGALVYITTEYDVITMVKGERKTFGASLANSNNQSGFSFNVSGKDILSVTGSLNGACLIEAKEAGVSEITIRNAQAVGDKQVLVVVANTQAEKAGLRYLSTKQNVVTAGEGSSTTVLVSVEGAAALPLGGFSWTSSDSRIIEVVSSGQSAVFRGVKAGTAKVTVTHESCEYPLEIIANCVNPVLAAAHPYIIAPNILTAFVGDAALTVSAELAGGSAADNTGFSWRVSDGTIASVAGANESARVRALKEGVTQIIIHHPKAGDIERTVLLICEPKRSAECYITVSESIIRMAPSDGAKTLNAELAGGNAQDAYQFKWWADSYDIIDMNYSGASAILRPLSSGYVTVHVSHPKAAYQKDIIVYISQYSEFSFEKNAVSIVSGSMSFVNMRVPAQNIQTRIAYTVKTPGGLDGSHIVSASGTKNVCTLEAKAAGSAVVTASLIAASSGAVQASCELLVNVQESNTSAAYIDFTGSSILTIEKGVTRRLTAKLSGTLAEAGDSKALQWTSSDPDVLKIAPASISGVAVNDEVQVTALKDGREATITIAHEKAASNVILYCIIPGENAASIMLDRSEVNLILGDAPFALGANITNAQEDDYNNIIWSVQQSAEVVKLSGGGKKINALPNAVGSAVIEAKVPSSGRTASCRVNVEEPKSIRFDKTALSTYPGEMVTLRYTVSPAADTGTVTWTLTDAGIAQMGVDDKAGTVSIFTKYKEGVTRVTGTTARGSAESLVITNGWGNTLALDKSLIKTIPVDAKDGTFTVKYTLKPACADLRVWGLSNMILKAGTYDTYTENIYTIKANRHTVDPLSGVASGTLIFEPKGESDGAVTVQAWNPQAVLNLDGSYSPAEAARQTVQMKVYYNSYTFIPGITSRAGIYSRYDTNSGVFILGDGETLNFNLNVKESGGTPRIVKAEVRLSGGAEAARIALSGTGPYMLRHDYDYGAAGADLYRNETDNAERTNRAVRAFTLEGSVVITYRLFGVSGDKEYLFPLYSEVRNCPKDY